MLYAGLVFLGAVGGVTALWLRIVFAKTYH